MKKSLSVMVACAGLFLLSACAEKPMQCPTPPPAPEYRDQAVTARVLFDFNKPTEKDVKKAGKETVLSAAQQNDLAPVLAEVAKDNTAKFRIQGSTDSCGNAGYNYLLGERRAKAVKDYLVSKGVSPTSFTTADDITNVNTVGASGAAEGCSKKNYSDSQYADNRLVTVYLERKVQVH